MLHIAIGPKTQTSDAKSDDYHALTYYTMVDDISVAGKHVKPEMLISFQLAPPVKTYFYLSVHTQTSLDGGFNPSEKD